MIRYPYICLIAFLIAASFNCDAQRESLNGLVEKFHGHQQKTLQEKVFVHFDRSFYVGGETMWFKVYLVDGSFHHMLDISKVVYLEILDRNHQPVVQTKVKIKNGLGNGSISIPASLDSDNYTIRAYTNWMKNYSSEFYFQQTISIVNVFQRLEEKNKNQDNKLDVQFFPEGGSLIGGIQSKVAFRVVDSSGKGISFTGSVLNSKGDTIVSFAPLKFGIGNFQITPNVSEAYRIIIKESNGRLTYTQLPAVQSIGFTMMVTDTTQSRLKITVRAKELNDSSPLIYLIGHTRHIVNTATVQNLINGKISFIINKNDLSEGIVHLTVFNHRLEPVCERLYFNRPKSPLSAILRSDKSVYETRDKIIIQTSIESNAPQVVNASLSVFKIDSLQQTQAQSLVTYLWLNSDLRGSIESPEYYFSENIDIDRCTDNLMLTHGWSKFKWQDVLTTKNTTHKFLPEYRGHIISGKVFDTNSAKPVQGIPAYLSSPDKKIQPFMTYSDPNGLVLFETGDFFTGNKKIIAQTGAYQNTTRIEINSPYSEDKVPTRVPFLNLTPKLTEPLTDRSISMQVEDIFYRGRVKTLLQIRDSSAFYGNATEQYYLDDYTRFPLLEEVMREYVKGVRLRKKDDQFIFKVLNTPKNLVFENEPLILLDGVAVFDTDKIMSMDPLKIKQIDVVTNQYYYGQSVFDGVVSFKTYQGNLDGFQFDAGTLVLDYEGLQSQKEFFSPQYETPAAKQSRLPDMRSLLLWIPDLTITKKSQAIEFYSSDQPGSYQAIIQGISQQGQPIFQTHTFEVKSVKH